MNILAILAVTLMLAFLIESLVEYFVGEIANHIPAVTPFKWLIMYVAAAVGVLAAFVYQIDLISMLSDFLGVQQTSTTLGMVITGLAIGRGANFIHDLWKQFFTKEITTPK